MNRRTFLSAVTGGLLAAPPATEAQHQGKVYHLGTLNLGVPPAPEIYDARRDVVVVLRDLSYVEGRNLEVERRYADGRVERLPALAAELVQRQVDVIVASGSDAVRAAQAATKAIPIVILIAGQDPVELGLTPSLVDPGGTSPVSCSEAYSRASDWNSSRKWSPERLGSRCLLRETPRSESR